jgi:hypothetical protein
MQFGVMALQQILRDRRIELPDNVLIYGFATPVLRASGVAVRVQRDERVRLQGAIEDYVLSTKRPG